VVQSIFEPVIVTDAKGHVLKLNQASMELLGAASSDRMVLTNTPGGEKILDAVRIAVSMRRLLLRKPKQRCCPCELARQSAATGLRDYAACATARASC